jgi:hypothetical protein
MVSEEGKKRKFPCFTQRQCTIWYAAFFYFSLTFHEFDAIILAELMRYTETVGDLGIFALISESDWTKG